ncbi:hypothetical protein GOP47_0010197 [Adiantum capillus-veneris]|uniref:Protein kinase domain-containing protein n=1 Tax=Adiantum capillus-veneris TaxID=13818 RepID=A0A9D4UUM4_ADICA|nr:hypothetical protein GOP47_0010197 [Adiantum capillus-veneris]
MAVLCWVLFLLLKLCSFSYGSFLPDTERVALLQLKGILENPSSLAKWSTQTDFCALPPTPALAVTCEGGYVTHLQIVGSRASSRGKNRNGMLSSSFSLESLVVHVSSFSRLKVLQLSFLGLWGPLPSKLGRLSYLESLNMSSNFIWGVLPNRLMSLQSLQVLALDDNMLNGSLPQKWSSLPKLASLSLASNKIQGQISSSFFSQLPYLQRVNLDENLLSGRVPISLSNATNLQSLSLSGNQLSGNLPDLSGLHNLMALNLQDNQLGPAFPLLSPQLLYLALGKNKLQGPIPSSMIRLRHLQQLDLSSNLLSGVLPPTFFSLASIKYLNVARNRLSGSLPLNLTLASSVKMIDLSFNLLTGRLPAQMAALMERDAIRIQWNCFSTSLQPQNPFTFCQNAALASGIDPQITAPQKDGSGGSRIGILAGITGGVLAIALTSLFLLFLLIYRKRSRSGTSPKSMGGGTCMGNKSVCVSSELLANARYISKTLKLGTLGLPQFRMFSMDELYKATDYFRDSSLIGEGSRGKVYKGQLDDGSLVAINCLRKEKVHSVKKVKARIERLAKFRHQHLVSLLGYNLVFESIGANQEGDVQVYLVYEYVSNRTLQARLAGKGADGFGWLQRLRTIIGAAKGIHYLHSGLVPGIFDNDIKISNILLDQNLVAKVSDFGLAFPLDAAGDVDGRSQITNSLSPAESYRKKLLDKKDVYNFGVVLLEVLVGRPLTSRSDGGNGKTKLMESFMAEQGSRLEAIDPKILGGCNMESLETVLEITVKCLSEDMFGRPSMEDVLWNLQYALQVQDSSNGGSQEDFGDGLYPSDVHAVKGRKNLASVGKIANEDVGKPSSPNADFFR